MTPGQKYSNMLIFFFKFSSTLLIFCVITEIVYHNPTSLWHRINEFLTKTEINGIVALNQIFLRSFLFFEFFELSSNLILHQMFSIGFRSGLWAGQCRTFILRFLKIFEIDLAVWMGALSC